MLNLFGKIWVALGLYIAIVIATIFFTLTAPRDRQEAQMVVYENFFGTRPVHPEEARQQRAVEAQQRLKLEQPQARSQSEQVHRKQTYEPERQHKQQEAQPKRSQPASQVRDQVF